MRSRVGLLAVLAVGSVLAASAAARAQQALPFIAGAPPSASPRPNDVYGVVRFSLEGLKTGKKTSNAFQVLLDGLGPLLNKTGEYILAIEVLSDTGDVLARRAIVQSRRERSGFLIFNQVSKESESTEWYGDLLRTVLVRPDTNNVRIKVRSYYSAQTKFDLATFNLILDFITKTQTLGAAPSLQALWKPIADQMEGLLSSYETAEVSTIASLSFAKFGETAYPRWGHFVTKYYKSEDRERVYEGRVKVELDTVAARVVKLSDGGTVEDPFYLDVLAAARIGDALIETVLANSKDGELKRFMAAMLTDKGYEGPQIGEKCNLVYRDLAAYFTTTDALATYWALMHNYDGKLRLNPNAADCLSPQFQRQFAKLGLPTSDLRFLAPVAVSQPKSVPRAPGTAGSPAPGPAAADKTVDLKRLAPVLGDGARTYTYEYVPLSDVKPLE
ncbi:MAG: hypothetical protein NW217_01205 [Hyphomicrobiaceae bacterium]|nr:hypothetical protein [Hyphomicrobiaceae bacterium]